MITVLHHSTRRTLFAIGLILVLVGVSTSTAPHAAAQDSGEIQYNDPVIVTLTPGQTVTKTFAVLPGDTVEIKLSLLGQFTLSAVLIDPNQNAAPLQPGADGNIAVMLENAPLSGAYSLVLQSSQGTGDLLIQVNSDSVAPTPLPIGQVTLDITDSAARYELAPPVGMPETTLTLSASTGATLPGVTLVNGATGATALTVSAGQLPSVAITLPAQETFLLAVEPGDAPQQLALNWGQGQASSTSSSSSTESSSSSSSGAESSSSSSSSGSTSSTSGQSYTGACQMYFSGQVNIRSGPSTAYEPPIGQAQPGSAYPVTGHNGSYSWYQIAYNGQNGWVSGQIGATELQGTCTNVAVATYPPAPQQQQQPVYTPTYTYTPSQGQQQPVYTPTYTYTPSQGQQQPVYTPTYTYTPTQPTAQTAPPDANFNQGLTMTLDGTATSSDYVSYPDGDTEDRVRYDISGLNPNSAITGGQAQLIVIATCSGPGSEYIQFFTSGKTYGCGETVVNRLVTYDNRTGTITVTATGGSNTYVQWTLTGTATRSN